MSEAVSPRALSQLIGSIYDCALDPSRWEPTLAEIADAFDGQTASLSLSDLRHDRFLIDKSVGWEPYWVEQRAKHVPEIHARLKEWLALQPTLDDPFVTSRHLPASYLERSDYVRDCLKPNGIVDIMHVFLMRTPTHFSELGIGRHQRQGIITDREIELGDLLLPHLRRAVTISGVLDIRTIERARMAEALDAVRCGVVLTNEHGAILHANRSAEDMVRRGGPIRDVRGVLEAKAPSARRELRAAIGLALRDEAGFGKTGLAIRLSEPDLPPVFAHVLPMTGSDLRSRLQPEAVAAIFIGAETDDGDSATAIATAFGLTPAERRVLASLLAGRTPAETATDLGIGMATARTHIRNIFAKTGVSRQAELMRLAMQLASPARAGAPAGDGYPT